jgi:hypothetical protein
MSVEDWDTDAKEDGIGRPRVGLNAYRTESSWVTEQRVLGPILSLIPVISCCFILLLIIYSTPLHATTPQDQLNLAPLDQPLNVRQAKHLASRAGFGATPAQIAVLTGQQPKQALKFFMTNLRKYHQNLNIRAFLSPGWIPFPPAVRPPLKWPNAKDTPWALPSNPEAIAHFNPS